MNRSNWMFTVASFVAIAACNRSPEQDQAKAAEAQRIADDKGSMAQREANEKISAAQREANEKAINAKTEADKDTAKAQANANDVIRDTNRDTIKTRSDLHQWGQKAIDDVDSQIDDAKVKAQKAKAPALKVFNDALHEVEVKRDAVRSDLTLVDAQTGEGLANLKARIQKELDDLQASVTHLRGTI
jgi:hypothetical protein